ncbi:MAG: ABC transporter substrate-binding protein [Deltaproteobacteria bacterium]|nr:ABC transporter substrate-binding protein [Deltaproteobacteria bacterium]
MRKHKWLVSPATVMGFLCAATIYGSTAAAAEKNLFNQLVDRAKAEMARPGAKFAVVLDLNPKEVIPVLQAFAKEFPFVKEHTYNRINRTEEFQRLILEAKAGRIPPYDIFHVQFEAWPEMRDAGMATKPPFLYPQLVKSLPQGWTAPDPRAIDSNGYYLSASALIRIIAYNKNVVPADKVPKRLEDCLDPEWKGKFLYNSRPLMIGLQHDPKTRESYLKWLKGMAGNKPVLVRQQTEGLERLAAGEYALYCGVNYNTTIRIIGDGAPLGMAFPDPYAADFAHRIHVFKWAANPATGQLYALWMATQGQPAVEEHMHRGFPWNPKTGSYSLAKGKYAAICDSGCAAKMGQYLQEHAKIVQLPGGKN